MDFADLIGTTLEMEEIAKMYDYENLYILNDRLAEYGISKCIICGTWVDEVNDDWECSDCESDNNEWKYPDWDRGSE